MIIIVSGLPGSGKSFFARSLAAELQFEYLNTDLLRKEMFPERNYSKEEKRLVYNKLKEGMITAVRRKKSIILDGTFHSAIIRNEFIDYAQGAGEPCILFYVKASDKTIRERLSRPRQDSEADWDVHQKIRQEFEEIKQPYLVLNSEEPIEVMIKQAREYIRTANS